VIKKPQRRRSRPELGCRAIGWMDKARGFEAETERRVRIFLEVCLFVGVVKMYKRIQNVRSIYRLEQDIGLIPKTEERETGLYRAVLLSSKRGGRAPVYWKVDLDAN
jgi:hypothetical protein